MDDTPHVDSIFVCEAVSPCSEEGEDVVDVKPFALLLTQALAASCNEAQAKVVEIPLEAGPEVEVRPEAPEAPWRASPTPLPAPPTQSSPAAKPSARKKPSSESSNPRPSSSSSSSAAPPPPPPPLPANLNACGNEPPPPPTWSKRHEILVLKGRKRRRGGQNADYCTYWSRPR